MKHVTRNTRKFNIFILSLLACAICYMLQAARLSAVNMDSTRYHIEFGNVNIGAKDMSKTGSYKLGTTMGQLAAGEFSKSGYVIKAGFQYIHSIVPFTFSVSKTAINLGTLLPNAPATDSTVLSVSFGAAGNYQVTAVEQGPLKTMSNNSIPDTSCDSGCDETTAKQWISNSAFGFGYGMTGEDIPATFASCGSNCYRRFPDNLASPTPEAPAVVMTSNDVTVDLSSKPKDIIHQATMTFKANVSGSQAGGSYLTVINYVATPSY